MTKLLATTAMVLALAAPAHAADIWAKNLDGIQYIFLRGDIVVGDSDKFNRIAASLPPRTVVMMGSDGGVVIEGLTIGQTIRSKQFYTLVPRTATCASICGFMWLAGISRYATDESRIGFHGAYNADTNKTTSGGNALIGAYLGQLGFDLKTIYHLTSTAPNKMLWMSFDMAKDLGITVKKVD